MADLCHHGLAVIVLSMAMAEAEASNPSQNKPKCGIKNCESC